MKQTEIDLLLYKIVHSCSLRVMWCEFVNTMYIHVCEM